MAQSPLIALSRTICATTLLDFPFEFFALEATANLYIVSGDWLVARCSSLVGKFHWHDAVSTERWHMWYVFGLVWVSQVSGLAG